VDTEELRYLREVSIPLIRQHGWIVNGFNASTSLAGNITYTAGLTEAGVAELAVAGLPHAPAGLLLNDAARVHLNSELAPGMSVPTSNGVTLRVVDAPGVIGPVSRSLYGQQVRFWQLLWPDPDGVYPDQPGWTATLHPRQPIYTDPPTGYRPPAGDGLVGLLDHLSRRQDAAGRTPRGES